MSLPLNDPLILALPRGGVPVALEIAKALEAPLDVLIVRKIGAPGHKELGIGAITENNHYWIDPRSMEYTGAHAVDVEQTLAEEREEVKRRIKLYREDRPLPRVKGRSVVVVDDGLATGVTARVACAYLKQQGAAEVILAVPVGSPRTAEVVRLEVDQLICLDEPDLFYSVGQFYEDFEQLEDEEVIELLKSAAKKGKGPVKSQNVIVTGGPVNLEGILRVPENARGIVIFAHGSDSSRFSPRNQQVAKGLNRAGIATLLFDLLTTDESLDRENVFNISLLGERLEAATRWVSKREDTAGLPIGYFGASTGGGAALWAAASLGTEVSAVVSRGGRPDLARERLKYVIAPTLLIVGGHDEPVIEMNRSALKLLKDGKLKIVPGATHLFEEPGALEQVESEAAEWFLAHFGKGAKNAVA
ncbi:MAG: phosphoribosyltransferase family protein [Bdellovibrionota bacterium]